MRPAIVAEKAGIPAVAVVTSSFLPLTRMLSLAEGMPQQRVAEYPGTLAIESEAVIRKHFERLTFDQIVEGLTRTQASSIVTTDQDRDEVTGTLEEIHELFYTRQWTDGLAIIPPTHERVEEFLKYTDRPPNEEIGILSPGRLRATPFNIGVNAIMAGCRPSHLPILIAAVEALADPHFNLEQIGTTGGVNPFLLVNGPIVKQLGLEYGIALASRGPNPAIGRAVGLVLRNIADLRPAGQAMGTFGYILPFVLAEDEEGSPWEPYHVGRGFGRNASTVTTLSTFSWGGQAFPSGTDPEGHLKILCAEIVKRVNLSAQAAFGEMSMMTVLINPSVAQAIGGMGFSKRDVMRYLFENSRVAIEAISFESRYGHVVGRGATIREMIQFGWNAPKEWADLGPSETVPVMGYPGLIEVVVCGDPNRNKAMTMHSVYNRPVTREVTLPRNWDALMQQ